MQNLKQLLGILFVLFIFSSCEKEEITSSDALFNKNEGYFILNEGAYGQGNASISYYNQEKDTLYTNVFESVNGKKLGDVLQSMTIIGDVGYLVVNNSAYIKVVDISSFEEIASIEGFTSPRFFQAINDNEAYVSDLFANKLWLVDLNSHTISDSIEINGWTEQMLLLDEKVYVSSPTLFENSSEVYVIDINTHSIVDTLKLKLNPSSMVLDHYGNLQVLCMGDAYATPKVAPSFHTINPDDHSQKSSFNMIGIPDAWKGDIVLDEQNNKLYILYGKVYEADILDFGLSWANVALFETGINNNLYGIGIDPLSNNLLLMDALDFTQGGSILEYQGNGIKVGEKSSGGIAPSKVVFY